jgi:tripartite-type tricarboxylate transporter receptor subunit TctC
VTGAALANVTLPDGERASRRVARHLVACLLLGGTAMTGVASRAEAEYPDHVVKAVVPFPAGGGTDVFARIVAPHLSKALGQSVVIENKGGAEGNIGMDSVAKSAPDGYTILFNSSAATVNPAMYKTLPFDPVRDLLPVAVLCEYYNVIVVNASTVPATTLGEFMELIRKNPGKYNAAAGGTRIIYELFKQQNKVDVLIVPYRGAADAITALLGGVADFMIVNAPGLTGHIASGKLRALAITAPQRQGDLPDVPTTREAGMPEFVTGSFFGAYVRAGTPPEIVRRLNAAFNGITAIPEVVEQFRVLGAAATQKTPDEAVAIYRRDIARMKDVVTRAGIPQME